MGACLNLRVSLLTQYRPNLIVVAISLLLSLVRVSDEMQPGGKYMDIFKYLNCVYFICIFTFCNGGSVAHNSCSSKLN